MPFKTIRSLRARIADTAGNSLVEAAVITPLLLLLTMAIVDLASIFYVYLALENGVSQASRYAVTGNTLPNPDDPGHQLSRQDSIKAAMRGATPSLTIEDEAFTFSHLTPGSSTWATGVGGPADIDKVEVHYTWSLMTPLMRPFFPDGEVEFVVDSAMKNEARFE